MRHGAPVDMPEERLRYAPAGRPPDAGLPPPPPPPTNGHPASSASSTYPFLSHSRAAPPAEGPRFKVEEKNILMPSSDPSSQQSHASAGAREPLPLSRDPSGSGIHGPNQDHRHTLSLALERGEHRGRGSPGVLSGRHPLSASSSGDHSGMVGEDASPHPKVLSLVHDSKRGRLSPLPQAVQGAQSRARGPASEPGIKNEFARMFSGIGSGVGSAMSTPAPPDSQAPHSFPSSPIRGEDADGRTVFGGKAGRVEGPKRRAARRSRKTKADGIKKEAEGENGAAGSGSRGQKRSRQNYAASNLTLVQPYVVPSNLSLACAHHF